MSKKAFTLIEVIAALGILTSCLAVGAIGLRTFGKMSALAKVEHETGLILAKLSTASMAHKPVQSVLSELEDQHPGFKFELTAATENTYEISVYALTRPQQVYTALFSP